MKNRKSSKIVMLVLALALVIGATAAITASADESTAPVVLSQNVEYADSFALMYAITADSVKGETVTLEVYEDAACEVKRFKYSNLVSELREIPRTSKT